MEKIDENCPNSLKNLPSILPNEFTNEKNGKISAEKITTKQSVTSLFNLKWNREDSDDISDLMYGNKVRFTVLILATLCLSSILSNVLTFNFAFICMAGEKPSNWENLTIFERELTTYNEDLDYSSDERSILFEAVAIGSLIGVFPSTFLLNHFGSRIIFGIFGFLSSFSTFLIPYSSKTSFILMIIMRILQGIAFSICLPIMGSITSNWSTIKQNGFFIAILSTFLNFSAVFTMPISGQLCDSDFFGWESIYYLHGFITLIFFVIFIFYHRHSPNDHPMISQIELNKVLHGKSAAIHKQKVPYSKIYKDIKIWAIFIGAFGNFLGTQMLLQFMPTYINKVLMIDVKKTGLYSAIAPIIMIIIKLIGGPVNDRFKFYNERGNIIIYSTIATGGMGVIEIILTFLNPNENQFLCLFFFIFSGCLLAFNFGGFFKSNQLISKQFSHFTMANISFINCICMFFVPFLNNLIAPNNTPETWNIVFWIHAILMIGSNLFFCIFADVKPAKWTVDECQTTKNVKIYPEESKSVQFY